MADRLSNATPAVSSPHVAVMNSFARAALLSLALVVLSESASAQTTVGRSDSVYTWRGAIPSRALLTIRNVPRLSDIDKIVYPALLKERNGE